MKSRDFFHTFSSVCQLTRQRICVTLFSALPKIRRAIRKQDPLRQTELTRNTLPYERLMVSKISLDGKEQNSRN